MKASELRLNNYVLEDGQVVLLSTNYDLFKCLINVDRGIGFEPIPLTEEWLLKFGFEINRQTKEENNVWRCYSEEGFFEVEQIGTSFFLDDNHCYGTKIDYVHQLQNLFFALVKEELQFKETTNE
jgi:hypothetical protein